MTSSQAKLESTLEALLASSPGDRIAQLARFGPADEVLLELIDGIAKLSIVNSTRAIVATELAIDLADRLGCTLARARARRAATRALAYAGRLEQARQVGADAVRIAEHAGLREEVGRAQLALMHPLVESGRIAEAIAAGLRARALFEDIGAAALAGRADINLGVVYQKSDDLAAAMECFDRARPHFDDDPLTRGHLDNNRGEALVAMNDFDAAERAFRAALAAFESSDASLTAAIAEGNLADLSVRRGRLAEALAYFEGARRRLDQSGSVAHLARLLAEQADAHLLLGVPQDALAGYETALAQLLDSGLALEAARARAGMGAALFRVGRLAEAETALAAAAVGFEELGHATARARADLIRAEIALARQQHDAARGIAMKSLAVLHDRPADAAQVRLLLARVALIRGDQETALTEISAGLIAARELDLAPLLADLLHARGALHLEAGRPTAAIEDLRAAIGHIERVHGSLQARRFRMAFLGDRTIAYEDRVRACLAAGGDASTTHALSAAERCKSRGLLDEMRQAMAEGSGDAAVPADEPAESLQRRLLESRSELDALYSRLADEQRHEGGRSAERLRWREALRQHEAQLDALESRLDVLGSRAISRAEDESLPVLPDDMLADSLIIEYFIARGELMAFAIGPDRSPQWQSLGDAADLLPLAKRLRFQLERGLHAAATGGGRLARLAEDCRRESQRLYERLLRPFDDGIDRVARLALIPHGPLHALPLHILFDGRRHLVERCMVHYAPSLAMLGHLWSRPSAADLWTTDMFVAGFGDDRAPQIEREARAVAARFRTARVHLGADAVTSAVVKAMASARCVHLACHGAFGGENPLGSGLALADGWLTARRIYGLRITADLVTLSACDTGRTHVGAGDELMGLARAMLTAGARRLVLAHWRIDDSTSADFMSRFYNGLGDGMPPPGHVARSLREAQLGILAEAPHPAFWGPFELVGAP